MAIDWRAAERDLAAILTRHYGALTDRAQADVAADLGRAVQPDERVLAFIADSAASRARGMAATQRERIATLRAAHAADPDALRAALTAAERDATAKAASVARTETTYAYNSAVAVTIREDGQARCYVTDGDGDPACAEVDGTYQSVEWCLDNPSAHPNCTRRIVAVDGTED